MKLEQLKQQVAQMFENATEKADIEKLAEINNTIDAVEQEQNDIISKNAELIKSYKDLVKHTSIKGPDVPNSTMTGASAPSFEEALENFMSKNK